MSWIPKTAAAQAAMLENKIAYREELLHRLDQVEKDIQKLRKAIAE